MASSVESSADPDNHDTMDVFIVDYNVDFFSSTIHAYGVVPTKHGDRTSKTEMVHVAITNVYPCIYVPFPKEIPHTDHIQFMVALREYCKKLKTGNNKEHVLGVSIENRIRLVGFRNEQTSPMIKLRLNSPWAVKVICKDFTRTVADDEMVVGKYRLKSGLYVYHDTQVELEATRRYSLGILKWNVMSKFQDLEKLNEEEEEPEEDNIPTGGKRAATGNKWTSKRPKWKEPTAKFMHNYTCEMESIVATEDASIPVDIKICVYDIECDGLFPHESKCYQIVGVIVDLSGKVIRAVGFTIVDVQIDGDLQNVRFDREKMMGVPFQVVRCSNEQEMIERFWDFAMANSSMVCDYNGHFYDFPFMVERHKDMPLGRLSNARSREKNGYGAPKFDGLPDLDMCEVIKAHPAYSKLDMFTLDHVVKTVLKKDLPKEDLGKDNMTPSQIIAAFTLKDPKECGRVLVYCLWDVLLTMMLMVKLNSALERMSLGAIVSMPLGLIVTTKNEAKIVSQCTKRAMDRNYVLNVPHKAHQYDKNDNNPFFKDKDEKGFEGATVLEPKRGFYKVPIPTLDYSSLYPSILVQWMLCLSTVVLSSVNLDHPDIKVITAPHNPNIRFARNTKSKRKPPIPEVVEENIQRRKKERKNAAAAAKEHGKGSFMYKRLDALQMAIKTHSNATYGVLGYPKSILYVKEIAETITAFGRKNIQTAIDLCKAMFNVIDENGVLHEHVEIIYGDTDSIMVKFSDELMEKNMVSEKDFPNEITIEDPVTKEKTVKSPAWSEKSYYERRMVKTCMNLIKPLEEKILEVVGIDMKNEGAKLGMLVSKKKKYGCRVMEDPYCPEEDIEVKLSGLDVVRRDNPGFVRNDLRDAIVNLVKTSDTTKLIADLIKIADKIVNVDDNGLEYYAATEGFNREDYDNKDASISIQIRDRMRKTMPEAIPQVGDRIQYVVICGPTDKVALNARHVIEFSTIKGAKIDVMYYLVKYRDKIENILDSMKEVVTPVYAHIDGLLKKLKPHCRQVSGQMKLMDMMCWRAGVKSASNTPTSPGELTGDYEKDMESMMPALKTKQTKQTKQTVEAQKRPAEEEYVERSSKRPSIGLMSFDEEYEEE